MEQWIDVKDTNGMYQISDLGTVASFCYGDKRIRKPFKDRDGYLLIGLNINGKTITKRVHHLVVENFIRDFDRTTEEVNHINHIRDDNRLQNLEIVTKQEHHKDPITIENMKKSFKGRVESEETKKKISQTLKRQRNTDQWKRSHSQKMKQFWAKKKGLK